MTKCPGVPFDGSLLVDCYDLFPLALGKVRRSTEGPKQHSSL